MQSQHTSHYSIFVAENNSLISSANASLRKHPFLLALRRLGRFAFPPREARRNGCFHRLR